ncbi:transcriptional regulator with XRE-family HTH domain [Streptomyces aurantiacus]|nr:transcriptional regulator with XRE-family HTH domain [Streptomyces aurantiacus]
MPVDPLWNSTTATQLAVQRRPGALVRLGRERRAWTLAALGERIGCSTATVSRLERRSRVVDLALVHRAAAEVGMTRHVLMASLAPPVTTAPAGTGGCCEIPAQHPQRPARSPKLFEQGGPPLAAPAEPPKYVQYEGFRPVHREYAPDTAGTAQDFHNTP